MKNWFFDKAQFLQIDIYIYIWLYIFNFFLYKSEHLKWLSVSLQMMSQWDNNKALKEHLKLIFQITKVYKTQTYDTVH